MSAKELNRAEIKQFVGELLAIVTGIREREPEAIAALEKEITKLVETKSAYSLNQRLFDLVRYQRSQLHTADLITNEEYAMLAEEHAAVDRLEDYDKVKARSRERETDLLIASRSVREYRDAYRGASYTIKRLKEALIFDQRDLNATMAKYLSGTGTTMSDLADMLNGILSRKKEILEKEYGLADGEVALVYSLLETHWLSEIICDHEAKTDVSCCACGSYRSTAMPTVGEAVAAWVVHVKETARAYK